MKSKTDGPQIAGSDLTPDFSTFQGQGSTEEFAYWLGVLDGCPLENVYAGGLTFQKRTERFGKAPVGGVRPRIAVVGGVNPRVSSINLEALREELPRMVVRFTEDPVQEQAGTGVNTGDPYMRGRRGRIVTIPTAEKVAAAIKRGSSQVPRYVYQQGDEPLADYLFLRLCENQDRPSAGHEVPPPSMSDTGVYWPNGAMSAEEADDLLST